jgi:hypothetical protein
MSALAARRDGVLERRLERLEQAVAELRRIDDAAAATTPRPRALVDALGTFARDVAATRMELRRARGPLGSAGSRDV